MSHTATQPEIRELELWADSFREGELFVSLVESHFERLECSYRYNFQPTYVFHDPTTDSSIRLTIFAGYQAWAPLPAKVKTLLVMGKPDVILIDPQTGSALLAIEETAAVPTGNQGLQRLERVWQAAEEGIPFVYLMSQFGLHVNGGIRTNSIWPAYLGLKLSLQYRRPSITLQYGSRSLPEAYEIGEGFRLLGRFLALHISQWLGADHSTEMRALLKDIYRRMGAFIQQQAAEITTYLPGRQYLTQEEFLETIVRRLEDE